MATEIERKFLVQGEGWRTSRGAYFSQGYLNRDKQRTVLVRIAGEVLRKKFWLYPLRPEIS